MEEEKKDEDDDEEFVINVQDASKFNKNSNMLQFIRKSIISNNQQLFNSSIEDIK